MSLYMDDRGVCGVYAGIVCRVQDCISLYAEYKLSMCYDTESPQIDYDLYDVAESLQPYIHTSIRMIMMISNPVSVYIVLSRRTNYPGRVRKLALHNTYNIP